MAASYNGRCLKAKYYATMQYWTRQRLNKNITEMRLVCVGTSEDRLGLWAKHYAIAYNVVKTKSSLERIYYGNEIGVCVGMVDDPLYL